jgi:hypothetical protein
VKETMQPVHEFTVAVNGQTIPILEAPLQAPNVDAWVKDSSERWEYLVRVEWIKTVSRDEAICIVRLRDPFTLERGVLVGEHALPPSHFGAVPATLRASREGGFGR